MRTLASPLSLLLLLLCAFAAEGRASNVVEGTTAASDGVRVAYDIRGQGDTAMVFVHCWACDRTFWREQLDAFADEYKVVSLDLPGHGASGADREAWSIAGLGGDVLAVVEALGLESVILVGHSMGGPVALEAARLMPERVRGVVCADTLHDAELVYPEEMAEQMATSFETDFRGTLDRTVGAMFPEGADPSLVDWVITRASASDETAVVALLRDFANVDLKRSLSAAGVPTT